MTVGAAISRLIIRVGGDYADAPVVDGAPGDRPHDGQGPLEPGDSLGPDVTRQRYRDVSLLIIGHCLLDTNRRAAAFADAVEDRDLDRVSTWPGAYSAIVLSEGVAVVYGDLSEQFPVYYSRRGGEILLGPEPGLIAAEHGRPPDPVTAAAHIACPAVIPLWAGRSCYTEVGRVPGGAVLWAGRGETRLRSPRPPLPVRGRSLAEGAALLRDALMAGIEARCGNGALSADFSGGLDSTSLAFLAAACSGDPVISIAYHQPTASAGDLPYALRYAALDSRIRLTVVSGSARDLPFADLPGAGSADGAVMGEPHPASLVARRALTRLAAAAESGARLHLTGEGGDAVLMSAPSYLATLARMGRPATLLRHSGGYARLRHIAPASLVGQAVRLAVTSPERALAGLADELADGLPGDATDELPGRRSGYGIRLPSASRPAAGRWADHIAWWPPCGEAARWLTPAMRGRLAELATDPATAGKLPSQAGPADMAALADVRRSGDAQRFLLELARPLGLPVHAPFLDTAVIRAALSVPAHTRANPWSYKPMLHAALSGLLPSEVLGRRTKGDYSAEDYAGARAAALGPRALLRESRLAALGVIEPAAVLPAIERMAAGVAVPLGPLNMLLATELWLRSIEPGQR